MKIENAERLVDLVYSVSTKKGAPNWPVVPLLSDDLGYYDVPIPFRDDIRVIGNGIAILSSITCEDGDSVLAGDRVMSRFRLSTQEEARLLARHLTPGTAIITADYVRVHGVRSTMIGTFIIARRSDGCTVSVKKNRSDHSVSKEREMGAHLDVAPGLKTITAASWTARLAAYDGAPSILLPTDAEGIYALFRDRSSGGGRRKALLHWVKGHVRASRERDVTVRPHLRGMHGFLWHDTKVNVAPPADSIEALEIGGRPAPSVVSAIERYRSMCADQSSDPVISDEPNP